MAKSATVSMRATSTERDVLAAARSRVLKRSCLTRFVVPCNAKSGQRAYLCQINQPNQLVSCLETICLGLALSTDFGGKKKKPGRFGCRGRTPKELDLKGRPDPHPPGRFIFSMGEGSCVCQWEATQLQTEAAMELLEGHLHTKVPELFSC